MNIYVGNLSYDTDDHALRQTFEKYGSVDSVNIIFDKFSGRSKGFGFIEMPDNSEAQKAIDELDGQDLDGRNIKVNQAKPREERGGGGYRGGGGNRGGGGGGGYGNRYQPQLLNNLSKSNPNEVILWTPCSAVGAAYDFPADEWHHIAVVSTGVSPTMYFDGQQKAQTEKDCSKDTHGSSDFGVNIGGGGI